MKGGYKFWILFFYFHIAKHSKLLLSKHTHTRRQERKETSESLDEAAIFSSVPHFLSVFFTSSLLLSVLMSFVETSLVFPVLFSSSPSSWLTGLFPSDRFCHRTSQQTVYLSVCPSALLSSSPPVLSVCLSSLSECELSYFWFFFFRTTSSRSPFPPLPSAGWLVVYR